MGFLKCLNDASKGRGIPGGARHKYRQDEDFDEEEFSTTIYPALESNRMDEVAANYARLTGKDFEKWFYTFMNDSGRRYIIHVFEEVIFDWVTRTYLIGSQAVRSATREDAAANRSLLRSLLKQRVEWPLPVQGIRGVSLELETPTGRMRKDIPVNLVYCTLSTSANQAPWLEYPVGVRVSLLLDGVLYYGVVWDASRKMEVAEVSI